MGHFAVLSEGASAQPTVPRVHINLWSLQSLVPTRRLFYFDVGMELKAGVTELSSFELMLPFRVEEGKWPNGTAVVQDLFESLGQTDTSELVFGGPVTVRSDADVHYLKIADHPDELRIIRVNSSGTKQADNYEPRADSSVYKVALLTPLQPGESGYIRMRWRVFGALSLWRWKRASGGATVDLRFCDVRESRFADAERSLRRRIVPIENMNVFVMAPPSLQVASHSPDFKYLRILEPGAWKHYLRGAHHIGGVRGLLVYYWRYPAISMSPDKQAQGTLPSSSPISINNPYRVFLDFNRAASGVWWMQVLRITVGVFLALLIFRAVSDFSVADLSRLSEVAWWQWITVVVGGSLVAVTTAISKLRRLAANKFLYPRRLIRAIERAVLPSGGK